MEQVKIYQQDGKN